MSYYPAGSALQPRPGTPSWLAAAHIFDHQKQERPDRDVDEASKKAERAQPQGKVGGGRTATETKK